MSHNQTDRGSSPWPYSGRGEKRPQTARARRTNFPLEPPEALRGQGQSREYRRWVDLCRFYGNRLGPERLADESCRALLLNLIHLTLQSERVRDMPLEKQPRVETQLHLTQEIRVLLSQLGLDAPQNGESQPGGLAEYLGAK